MSIPQEHKRVLHLIDSIPALVASIDCNMKLQFCNQPFKHWFQLDGRAEEQHFSLVVGQEVFQQLQRHMGKVLVGERAHQRKALVVK